MNKRNIVISIIVAIILIVAIVAIVVAVNSSGKEVEELQEINVSEVTRSVFYAPQYVAIAEGYFEEEGLEINLTTGQGADNVMTAVLSNQVEIGFAGPEASVYVYNEGKEDYTQVFAQLTKTDGSFLVSSEKIENINQNFGGKPDVGGDRGFEKVNGVAPVQAFDSIDAAVNVKVLLQLLAIGIGLTLVSSLAAMISIQKFSPLTILKERS